MKRKNNKITTSIKYRNFNQAEKIYNFSINDLVFLVHKVFRENFDQNKVQFSTLLNTKQERCSENRSYCSQSAHFKIKLPIFPLLNAKTVLAYAKKKNWQQTRFCMVARG